MVSMPAHARLRPSISSRVVSRASSASLSDNEDAITPAAPVISPAADQPRSSSKASRGRGRRRQRPVSRASSNADVPNLDLDGGCCSDGEYSTFASADPLAAGMDTLSLWHRMLAVQRVFGCYNSARISAALDDEDLQNRVPSRVCLDLLNDSILHLPDDEREQVQYYIQHGEMKPRKRWSLWRRTSS